MNNQLGMFESSFQKVSYLKDLSEKTIWDQYLPGIMVSGKAEFKGFTETNVQAFYRLKLQSIEKQIREKLAPGSELRQLPPPEHQQDISQVDQQLNSIKQQITHLYALSKPPPPVNLQPL